MPKKYEGLFTNISGLDVECYACNGSGIILEWRSDVKGKETSIDECEECQGHGKITKKQMKKHEDELEHYRSILNNKGGRNELPF